MAIANMSFGYYSSVDGKITIPFASSNQNTWDIQSYSAPSEGPKVYTYNWTLSTNASESADFYYAEASDYVNFSNANSFEFTDNKFEIGSDIPSITIIIVPHTGNSVESAVCGTSKIEVKDPYGTNFPDKAKVIVINPNHTKDIVITIAFKEEDPHKYDREVRFVLPDDARDVITSFDYGGVNYLLDDIINGTADFIYIPFNKESVEGTRTYPGGIIQPNINEKYKNVTISATLDGVTVLKVNESSGEIYISAVPARYIEITVSVATDYNFNVNVFGLENDDAYNTAFTITNQTGSGQQSLVLNKAGEQTVEGAVTYTAAVSSKYPRIYINTVEGTADYSITGVTTVEASSQTEVSQTVGQSFPVTDGMNVNVTVRKFSDSEVFYVSFPGTDADNTPFASATYTSESDRTPVSLNPYGDNTVTIAAAQYALEVKTTDESASVYFYQNGFAQNGVNGQWGGVVSPVNGDKYEFYTLAQGTDVKFTAQYVESDGATVTIGGVKVADWTYEAGYNVKTGTVITIATDAEVEVNGEALTAVGGVYTVTVADTPLSIAVKAEAPVQGSFVVYVNYYDNWNTTEYALAGDSSHAHLETGHNSIDFTSGKQFDLHLKDNAGHTAVLYKDGVQLEAVNEVYTIAPADGDIYYAYDAANPKAGQEFEVTYNDMLENEISVVVSHHCFEVEDPFTTDTFTLPYGALVQIREAAAESQQLRTYAADEKLLVATITNDTSKSAYTADESGDINYFVSGPSNVDVKYITRGQLSGIENVEIDGNNTEDTIFNLQGIKVSRDNIPAGIYIINGKKQVVR